MILCAERRKARFSLGNMLKSFMYIKNYKRIILILAFLLLYISMYLIHNAYGPLCLTKSGSDSVGKGDVVEVARLYKANNLNLFVSNVHKSIDWDCARVSVCALPCFSDMEGKNRRKRLFRNEHVSNHD